MNTESKVRRLETTLGTLIAWLAQELGQSNAQQLLTMLSEEDVGGIGEARAVDGL